MDNGISLRPEVTENKVPGLSALLGVLPLSAGLAVTAAGLLPSTGLPWWAVFLAALALLGVLLVIPGRKNWLFPAGCGLLLVTGLIFAGPLGLSAGWLLNDLLSRLTVATGRIYLEFETGGGSVPAFLWGAGCLVLLDRQALTTGKFYWLLPALLLTVVGAVLGENGPGLLLICLGMAGCLLPGGWRERGSRFLALCLAGAAALGLGMAGRNLPLEQWKSDLRQAYHALRWDNAAASMPEGRLDGLGAWEKSDAPALKVTLSQPEAMYLRGGVYEVYTGQSWEKRANADRAEASDLYYWLHAADFYGQSQIASAAAQAGVSDRLEVTVENVGACRAHGYWPYGSALSADPEAIGDDAFPAENTFVSVPGSLQTWYGIQRTLAEEGRGSDYLTLERAYAADVTAADLQLTETAWQVLNRQLGEDTGSRTLGEIQTTIRDYLAEHLHYDEQVHTPLGNEDFLHYVLERSNAGYSVHYATAAVLMLRYFGVPARYVEGYYLMPEQAEAMETGEAVTLTEENAHAWAEFYLNGVGFIPFEVTPGYIRQEELDFGNDENGGGQSVYTATPREFEQPQGMDSQQEPPRQSQFQMPRTCWLLAGLLLLFLLVLPLIRRARFLRKMKKIDQGPCREAIQAKYGYARYLMTFLDRVPEDTAAHAAELNREAAFSGHPMTEEQRQEMDAFVSDLKDRCKKAWNVPKSIYYRWFRCVI